MSKWQQLLEEKRPQKEKDQYRSTKNYTHELKREQNENFAFILLRMQTVGL
tara:strand:- start:411 stop:563 length:153 start_codon:yes stop_codon:yes gene_type:complete